METHLAILALLIAGYALVAARLGRLSVGPALAFVAIGILISDDVIGPVSLEPAAEPVKVLAEATLTLLLFADASALRARAVERDIRPVARLLIVGLMLTIGLGTVGAFLVFPGISLGLALLIGAALAPTDAALGQPVVTNPAVPARIRRVLSVESGLNDGIATPFVFVALALATAEATGTGGWLSEALLDVGIGVAVGVGLGFLGGRLLSIADARHWTSSVSRQLFVLALAGACYLVAVGAGGNGFIGAFVGGLAFGRGSKEREDSAVRFVEEQGSLLAIGVWTAFGLSVAGELLTSLWDPRAIAYALLSLTVIRMLPVAIALLGARFRPLSVLFVGWFGPRGLASIVFLIIGLESLEHAGIEADPFVSAVAWTVFLSVILHGLTAGPLASRYGRHMNDLAPGAPELDGTELPRPSRGLWAGDGQP
ncbi:MAG: cation:proton antiporter [Candidatus Limnocylindrales bacterium]